jgi:hypothetical protein
VAECHFSKNLVTIFTGTTFYVARDKLTRNTVLTTTDSKQLTLEVFRIAFGLP